MSRKRNPKKHYTTVTNSIIKDPSISCKALGVYVYIVSKQDDWDFSADRIAKEKRDGREAIQSAVNELIRQKYMIRLRNSDGTVEYIMTNNSQEWEEEMIENDWIYDPKTGFCKTKPPEPESGKPTEAKTHSGKTPLISKTDSEGILNCEENLNPSLGEEENKTPETQKIELAKLVRSNPKWRLLQKLLSAKNFNEDDVAIQLDYAISKFLDQGKTGNPFWFVQSWFENLRPRIKNPTKPSIEIVLDLGRNRPISDFQGHFAYKQARVFKQDFPDQKTFDEYLQQLFELDREIIPIDFSLPTKYQVNQPNRSRIKQLAAGIGEIEEEESS
jgi:hypothetical protein